MPPAPSLASHLAARLSGRPSAWAAVARAVAEEDAAALARCLRALDLEPAADVIERLLDLPGPFGPSFVGCT